MTMPVAHPTAVVAVTADDDAHAAVIGRARAVARSAGATIILWERDAATSPLESPLPTDWSGEGDQEQFGDRLGPGDLIVAGREPLARQIGELRKEGLDAWAWLPDTADAEHLAAYAADQHADLVLVSAADADLLADLRELADQEDRRQGRRLRVEAVPA